MVIEEWLTEQTLLGRVKQTKKKLQKKKQATDQKLFTNDDKSDMQRIHDV